MTGSLSLVEKVIMMQSYLVCVNKSEFLNRPAGTLLITNYHVAIGKPTVVDVSYNESGWNKIFHPGYGYCLVKDRDGKTIYEEKNFPDPWMCDLEYKETTFERPMPEFPKPLPNRPKCFSAPGIEQVLDDGTVLTGKPKLWFFVDDEVKPDVVVNNGE
jgi:hypothetical protein